MGSTIDHKPVDDDAHEAPPSTFTRPFIPALIAVTTSDWVNLCR